MDDMNIFVKHEVRYILSHKRKTGRFLLNRRDNGFAKVSPKSPALSNQSFLEVTRRKKLSNPSGRCSWAIDPLEVSSHKTKTDKSVKAVWKATC